MKSYRELLVWQKAMDLVAESYRIAASLPKSELYGLTSQIQRAAVSIPANIAEVMVASIWATTSITSRSPRDRSRNSKLTCFSLRDYCSFVKET